MIDFTKLVTPPNIRPDIQALCDRGNITVEEYESLQCNGDEWRLVQEHLSPEALIHAARHCLKNCGTPLRIFNYEHALVAILAPQLVRHLERHNKSIEAMIAYLDTRSSDESSEAGYYDGLGEHYELQAARHAHAANALSDAAEQLRKMKGEG